MSFSHRKRTEIAVGERSVTSPPSRIDGSTYSDVCQPIFCNLFAHDVAIISFALLASMDWLLNRTDRLAFLDRTIGTEPFTNLDFAAMLPFCGRRCYQY